MSRFREGDAEVWFSRGRYGGQACIYGRRLPVAMVIRLLMEDGGRSLLRDDYSLNDRQIDGAVAYTLRLLGDDSDRETLESDLGAEGTEQQG
jgi:uncharacterized protein (DUF433 family)